MMKKAVVVFACLCTLVGGVYFAASKWAIRHESLNFFDAARQRPVAVDVAVRRDYEMKANEGYWKLPVAIISNGNTVKNTEYSFLANVLAARGYLVASIQQDLPSDPPLMTRIGLPYVGRQEVYERGEANILFVLGQLKELQPNADYGHLTLVGHSNGGDISMFCAERHPELVSKVITLDNLRVPFVLSDKLKILSFRSKDPNFKTDPGVLPTAQQAIDGRHRYRQHEIPAYRHERPWPRCRQRNDSSHPRPFSGRQRRQRTGAREYRRPDRYRPRTSALSVKTEGNLRDCADRFHPLLELIPPLP